MFLGRNNVDLFGGISKSYGVNRERATRLHPQLRGGPLLRGLQIVEINSDPIRSAKITIGARQMGLTKDPKRQNAQKVLFFGPPACQIPTRSGLSENQQGAAS